MHLNITSTPVPNCNHVPKLSILIFLGNQMELWANLIEGDLLED